MITILCILWVMNMLAACAKDNTVRWINIFSAGHLTITLIVLGLMQ